MPRTLATLGAWLASRGRYPQIGQALGQLIQRGLRLAGTRRTARRPAPPRLAPAAPRPAVWAARGPGGSRTGAEREPNGGRVHGSRVPARSRACRPRRIRSAIRVRSYSATAPRICSSSWSWGSALIGRSKNSTRQPCRPSSSTSSTWWTQVAGQPVRLGHHDHVQLGQRGVVTQPVQTRPTQTGAAVAIVTVDMLVIQDPATLTHGGTQPLKLLLDGLRLGLAAGGDPRIHPRAHQAPPVALAPPPGRRRAAPSPSAPAAGRPDPNGGRRRGGD